jgi:hypothetical protein
MECLKMGHAMKALPPATRSGYPLLSSSMGLEQDGNEVYYLLLKIMFYVSVV